MKNIAFIVFVVPVLVGCTTVKKTSENEYEVTVQGGPFDSIEALKEKASSEAQKVCGTKSFEFVKNWMGDDFAFKQEKHYTQYGDYNYGTAIAKIKCMSKK
ncbi:hypothetical protein Rhein_3406 [Rheinheimera sp. A13L]|uniref:hypothetical protein n=1 Tax=Rheinheimera sp. A13L TaxID=506534 RepID=UPI000212492F|nr:hypothetical protein [Rheinheimera sp. A13L]EGM76344.1 hypothetical protein Rhein_3406 [Rheinheimera sp. A13L]